MRKSALRRGIAALALAAALVPVMGGTAGAVSPLPIVCTAAGSILYTNTSGVDHWSLIGKGSCQGDLEGTYFVDFTGTGTSDSLGACDQTIVVQNLHINILGTLTNLATGSVKLLNQDWVAPITTYPLATPFLVQSNGGDLLGAGNFFNHIFLNCAGSPTAQFTWAFLT